MTEKYKEKDLRELYRKGYCECRMQTENCCPIVSCRDCKWYREGEYFAPTKFCFRLKDKNGKEVGYNFAPDDFCSRGERKDEVEND